MDRQLLLSLVVTALILGGCSGDKSPPPAQAVTYQQKTTYDFPDDHVSDDLLRPSGSDLDESPVPTSPGISEPTDAIPGSGFGDLADGGLAEAKQRVLDKIAEQSSGVLGVLGGSQKRDGEEQPRLATELGTNSLRGSAPSAAPPEPATANPLRTARSLPQPATQRAPPPRPLAAGQPLAADQPSASAAAPPPPPTEPSGGAAPPPAGWLAEMERAFAANPSPGSAASESPAPQSAGPAAPEATPPTTDEPDGAGFSRSLAKNIAGDSFPSAPASEEKPFDVVEVFYGTDRQSGEAPPSDWQHILLCFLPTASVGLMAACLAFVATGRKSWLLGAIAIFGIAVSLGLGYEGVGDALALVRSAGHQGPRYTVAKSQGGHVDLGRCEVTIPSSHSPGEVESPSLLRLEIKPEAAEHLMLHKTERLADARFYEALRVRVAQSPRREVFVFVHGFNVSFEDAALRTAQFHYDLKFEGAPIFFSWPANDRFLFTYPADETNVAWSVPHLKQFLLSIVKESQAKSINLIAHSMGNRALAAALREIELELRDQSKLFNQVILAAPDIDADDFRHNIAPAMQRTAQRLTLYASSRDEALLASQYLHRGPRAGNAGDELIVLPGIDTIDVTPIDRSLWGHAYYGSSNPVLNDLRALLSRAVPPRDRKWLSPAERDGQEYWIFQPARTAEAHGELTR